MTTLMIRSRAAWLAAVVGVTALVAACNNDPVSNLNQVVPGFAPDAFNARLGGVVYMQKFDFGTRINAMDSFARVAANFTITDPRSITEWLGDGVAIENSTFYATSNWTNQFTAIRNAQSLLADLPKASPAYSAGDVSKFKGIVYTLEALSYMYAAETKDTLGVPVQGPLHADPAPQPILCSRNTWKFIVALLDSGLTQLNADQTPGLPGGLDAGFSAVSAKASPSTSAGSFAGFNRALAVRANLELAYAIARSPGGTPPTITTAGAPDATALQRADSALHATFLYNTGALAPPDSLGDFNDPLAVYHLFSGQSGDIPNPLNATITTYFVLNEAVNAMDPADLRFTNKFKPNVGTAVTSYNIVASPLTLAMYGTPNSPIPIIRNEELHLYSAQIRLGLNDLAGAVAEINNVRTLVGHLAPVANPGTYTGVRDLILHEYIASTTGEPAGDRTAAIRDYALPTVADTTWDNVQGQGPDTHATVQPFPVSDVTARNGNTTYTCQ